MRPKLITILVSAVLSGAPMLAPAQAHPADAGSVVDAPPPNYTDSVARLNEAAQRLRQAIQAMAQQPAGPRRDVAIAEAHEALADTQDAMIRVPPESRTGASPGRGLNETQSMARLQQAAQKLREAVQAMATQPAGERRAAAAREAREALLETQQAMVWLPPAQRSAEGRSAAGSSSARGPSRRETAHEADGLPYNDVITTPEGVRYLTGGIGVEAQERLNARADDFNLKLVFTLEEGNYIADVGVAVEDEAGREVLDAVADGPILLAELPPGHYTVTATYGGDNVTRKVSVGERGTRTAYLRWPSNPETDFIPRRAAAATDAPSSAEGAGGR